MQASRIKKNPCKSDYNYRLVIRKLKIEKQRHLSKGIGFEDYRF